MKKSYYQPVDNYERNFFMTKDFCGKFTVLLVPILLFMSMLCSCYLNMTSEKSLEYYIFKVANSSFGFEFDIGSYDTVILICNILISAFFIFAFLNIYFTSKNSDAESSPDFGLSLLYRVSQLELFVSFLGFIALVVVTAVFMFGDVERFESVGEMFNMTVSDLKAYKVTIVFILILADVLLFLLAWYMQAQTDMLKSIRRSLHESLPKNKGAKVYGIFSLTIGIAFLCFAALLTFLYYCYRDAFVGFGISLDMTYVYISLASSYIRGLIPFMLGINSFIYSSMVEEINTFGTLYNNYTVIGTADDPNMSGRMYR